ncbi:MAG: apolipoprotein N-acyltransferase [bacterium]|nr:apolipoprotein N-acyltransferase [bacterium]
MSRVVAGIATLILVALSFPPLGYWPLAFAMLVPMLLALEHLSVLRAIGFVWLTWIAVVVVVWRSAIHILSVEFPVPAPLAWIVLLLVGLVGAIPPALAAGAYGRLRPKLRASSAPLVFAAFWVLAEWFQVEALRLPWLLSSHTLARVPLALQTADLFGAYAVSFLLVSLNAGLAIALLRRSLRPALVPLLLAVLAAGYGAWRLSSPAGSGDAWSIGLVQAAVPQSQRFQPGSALRNTRRHQQLTRALAEGRELDLVIWSETTIDTDLDQTPRLRQEVEAFAKDLGVPILTGAPRSKEGSPTNSVVLIQPDSGIGESYDKQVLVPFAESDPPLRPIWQPLLGELAVGVPYVPGRVPTVFASGPGRFSTPICFETVFPGTIREFVREGAGYLINLSNDVWFGSRSGMEMQFRHAIFRAVEHRSWVVRAANTGISGFIDPAGRIVASIGSFDEGTLTGSVQNSEEQTLYAWAGDLPLLVILVALPTLAYFRDRHRTADCSPNPADSPQDECGVS